MEDSVRLCINTLQDEKGIYIVMYSDRSVQQVQTHIVSPGIHISRAKLQQPKYSYTIQCYLSQFEHFFLQRVEREDHIVVAIFMGFLVLCVGWGLARLSNIGILHTTSQVKVLRGPQGSSYLWSNSYLTNFNLSYSTV